jgi:hypothetical protein
MRNRQERLERDRQKMRAHLGHWKSVSQRRSMRHPPGDGQRVSTLDPSDCHLVDNIWKWTKEFRACWHGKCYGGISWAAGFSAHRLGDGRGLISISLAPFSHLRHGNGRAHYGSQPPGDNHPGGKWEVKLVCMIIYRAVATGPLFTIHLVVFAGIRGSHWS